MKDKVSFLFSNEKPSIKNLKEKVVDYP